MPDRWMRDVGIAEMIEYFDRPERRDRWDLLSAKELGAITDQIDKCRGAFEYAARNYFWITDKRGNDTPFRLWPSQDLILERINDLKARNRAQRLFILKARQLGASTLIEAIIAWRTMFFPNIEALVVSVDEDHSASLFAKMLHIYDLLPWWLKPKKSSREYKGGIWFENPDENERRYYPGLNSRVTVQHSTQVSGIGQGRTVQAAHISELSDWFHSVAKRTIEGDLRYAMPDNVETFGVIETTGRGQGGYCEKLWDACQKLGDEATWIPTFLPAFFEPTRVLAPDKGWRPDGHELSMKERVASEWVKCDHCGTFREAIWNKKIPLFDTECPTCSKGLLKSYELSNEQLWYMRNQRINAEAKGEESLKELRQELCITPQDAWQLSGIQVFPRDVMDFVNTTVRPAKFRGHLDQNGRFHGPRSTENSHCYQWKEDGTGCQLDHRYDEEMPLLIWEWPETDATYVIGADVADGNGGDYDHSVAFVNRVGKGAEPDRQVAMFRTNTMDGYSFATPVVQLGHMYNGAMLSIEYNLSGRATGDTVRVRYQYPNLFRWKHYDSVYSTLSHRWHWVTQQNTKPKLITTARRWLRQKLWIIRSEDMYSEMKTFEKESEDSVQAGATGHNHDDIVMAGMIALFTSHDMDYSEELDYIPVVNQEGEPCEGNWQMTCNRCANQWFVDEPEFRRCPKCGCPMTRGKPVDHRDSRKEDIFSEMLSSPGQFGDPSQKSYDAL